MRKVGRNLTFISFSRPFFVNVLNIIRYFSVIFAFIFVHKDRPDQSFLDGRSDSSRFLHLPCREKKSLKFLPSNLHFFLLFHSAIFATVLKTHARNQRFIHLNSEDEHLSADL